MCFRPIENCKKKGIKVVFQKVTNDESEILFLNLTTFVDGTWIWFTSTKDEKMKPSN